MLPVADFSNSLSAVEELEVSSMTIHILVLGLSAFYHDSAACLLRDGHIVAAAQEERFTRKKHDAGFPRRAICYCLQEGGISLNDLRYIVFYDKPLLKFERLLETYLSFAPRGLRSFVTVMPVWLKEKLLLKTLLSRKLRELADLPKKSPLPPPFCLRSITKRMPPRLSILLPFLMPLFSVWMV